MLAKNEVLAFGVWYLKYDVNFGQNHNPIYLPLFFLAPNWKAYPKGVWYMVAVSLEWFGKIMSCYLARVVRN